MESQLYLYARELFATAQLDWRSGVVRAVLLPAAYVPDFTDQYLSDIPVGSRIAVSNEIELRTALDGVCYGTAAKFPLLFDNRAVSQAVIYRDTGTAENSILIAYLGDEDLVNEPFVPVGFDYYIYPNMVEGGFFRL